MYGGNLYRKALFLEFPNRQRAVERASQGITESPLKTKQRRFLLFPSNNTLCLRALRKAGRKVTESFVTKSFKRPSEIGQITPSPSALGSLESVLSCQYRNGNFVLCSVVVLEVTRGPALIRHLCPLGAVAAGAGSHWRPFACGWSSLPGYSPESSWRT